MDSPWIWKKWHIERWIFPVGIKIDVDDDDSDWLKMMGHWNSNHLNNFSKTNDDDVVVDDDKKMSTMRNCSDWSVFVLDDDCDCNVDDNENDLVDDDCDDNNDRNSMMNSKVMTIDLNSMMNLNNVDVDWHGIEHDIVDNVVDHQQINIRIYNDKILSID